MNFIIPERYYDVDEETGCWNYNRKLNDNGRPNATFFGMPAFRVLVMIRCGPPPTPEHQAAHTCHNRRCINPEHGEWQTSEQNNPRAFSTDVPDYVGVPGVRLKWRRSTKGGGRRVEGWCAVFRHDGKTYKSGAYYTKEAALRWARNKRMSLGTCVGSSPVVY